MKEEISKQDISLFTDYLNRFKQPSLFDFEESPHELLEKAIALAIDNKLYKRFNINNNGKSREISVPDKALGKFISKYISPLIDKVQVHQCCHGGIKTKERWTPKKSLESHLPCKSALSFDLKSAFKNTSYDRVYEIFYNCLEFFEQKDREDFSKLLTILCTVKYSEIRGLPQGAEFSMALFNRSLYSLDEILFKKCREKGFKYSRWVDDITITSYEHMNLEEVLGAAKLVDKRFGLSSDKLYFQQNFPIYLLGHKIIGNSVIKNNKDERIQNKIPPLDFSVFYKIDYKLWD